MSEDDLENKLLDLEEIDKQFWETVEWEYQLYLNTINQNHEN